MSMPTSDTVLLHPSSSSSSSSSSSTTTATATATTAGALPSMDEHNFTSCGSALRGLFRFPRTMKQLIVRGVLTSFLLFIFYYMFSWSVDLLFEGGRNNRTPRPPPSGGWGNYGAEKKQAAIKQAMQHAWSGYREYAFGKDELTPLSRSYSDRWGGWGVTLIDSLDTLHIMGLHDEYMEARDYVLNVNFSRTTTNFELPFFEMVIRSLGGLLGAYELTNDKELARKAKEVGGVLVLAFNTPHGIPYPKIDVAQMQPIFSSEICVAEAGSVQLEFMKLSEITGDPSYDKKAQKVVDILDKARKPYPGLYPTNIDTLSGKFTGGRISFGAMVDSWYEYLLKQYLLSNKSVEKFRRMYTESIDGMKKKLVAQSLADPSLFYVGEMDDDASVFYGNFGHLTCFVPGMLALGAKELGLDEDLDLAKKLMRTCFKLYNNTVTKLSPESVVFATNADVLDDNGYISPIPAKLRDMPRDSLTIQQGLKDGYFVTKPWYILRPEVVESLFVLYRITGDELYRDWSWQIFLAIENYTKTPIAYSAYDNVMRTNQHKQWRDSMESFFLGETLKYLYLTFSPSDLISLDEFVFNTEAHPFRIIKQ